MTEEAAEIERASGHREPAFTGTAQGDRDKEGYGTWRGESAQECNPE